MTTARPYLRASFVLALLVGGGFSAAASAQQALSPEMRTIAVDEHRGGQIDPNLTFRDRNGETVRLGELLDDGRPTLLTLNYFRCRVICSVQLQGLAEALSELEWSAGDDPFRIVTVSIDPRETPEDATARRSGLLGTVGKGDDLDWRFLTGDALNIKALAAQLGIQYAYDSEQDQYAHPAVAVFIAPGGTVSQYLYGLTFLPRDLKFALMEASSGKLGNAMDQLILSCFHYDASIGRYGPFAFGVVRLGGVATFAVLATVLVVFWRKERQYAAESTEAVS